MINEKLFEDVFGVAYATVPLTKYNRQESIVEKIATMPVKENEAQELNKKSPETFFYRQGKYKSFKDAFRASGFTPFTADIFGNGEDDYRGKEAKMLDYLTELYIKMYGACEREYQKEELAKALKAIDRLRLYL